MLETYNFNLFTTAPNTDLAKMIEEVLQTGLQNPEIYKRIETDLDNAGLAKKKDRILDNRFKHMQTPFLSSEFKTSEHTGIRVNKLETGCPRISPEEVLLFIVLRSYWGSVTDKRAVEMMRESTSLSIYYSNKNKRMPKPKTIHDNLGHIQNETLEFIYKCQIDQILNEGLDDFSYTIFDSTSVWASSSWPTDAGVIYRLLARIYKQCTKTTKFGITPIADWYMPDWLKKLSKLLFEINNTKGTAKTPKKKKIQIPYRDFLNTAHKMNEYLIRELEHRSTEVCELKLKPTKKRILNTLWDHINDDILSLSSVLYYAHDRVFNDVTLPASEKILSISDRTAAFIKKGQRNPVLGYKPQIGMSFNGYVSALIVEKGNGADSDYLVPLLEQHITNTGVTPAFLLTDDGYSSAKGRNECLGIGVKDVCFSGSVGRKILGDLWNEDEYQEGRKKRSAVESLMFTLKYVFQFGRLRRRGIEAVKAEMLGIIIAYNYRHKIRKRRLAMTA